MATIFGFGGLRSIEDHQALLETIAVETLALENSVARNRAVNAIVATGVKLLAIGEFEEPLEALEAAHRPDEEAGGRERVLTPDPPKPWLTGSVEGRHGRRAD